MDISIITALIGAAGLIGAAIIGAIAARVSSRKKEPEKELSIEQKTLNFTHIESNPAPHSHFPSSEAEAVNFVSELKRNSPVGDDITLESLNSK